MIFPAVIFFIKISRNSDFKCPVEQYITTQGNRIDRQEKYSKTRTKLQGKGIIYYNGHNPLSHKNGAEGNDAGERTGLKFCIASCI
jgi:hypothetical protein